MPHNSGKLFLFFFFFSFWTPVHSQTIPDLSRLGYETRSSIMLICAIVKSRGPAVYAKCIRNRFNEASSGPAVPDLSRLDYETFSSIMLACALVKFRGPAAYVKCIRDQLAGIGVSPKGEGNELDPIPKMPPDPPPIVVPLLLRAPE